MSPAANEMPARASSARGEAIVDLEAVRGNLASLRPLTGGAAHMVVVKADAYGHGAVPVARAAREAGTEWLGVAFIEEALQLRAAGDRDSILAWLCVPGEPHLSEAIESGIDLAAGSELILDDIAGASRMGRARVHLKVDSGLGRGGCSIGDWSALLERARSHGDRIEVVGLMSHLACADSPGDPSIDDQLAIFATACDEAAGAGFETVIRHISSSASAITRADTHFDLVRIGIAAYGVSPGPSIGPPWPDGLALTPAMTLTSRVALTKRVPAGHGVSYGLTWRAPRETTLALVPLGYADGLPRTAREARVWVNGECLPIVGRIAMDQVVIDAGDRDIHAGDPVTIFGSGTSGEPTAADWATWDDTIAYEIVTRIGPRVPRRYVGA